MSAPLQCQPLGKTGRSCASRLGSRCGDVASLAFRLLPRQHVFAPRKVRQWQRLPMTPRAVAADWHVSNPFNGYQSGCNIPWIRYGYDFGVGDFNKAAWDAQFQKMQSGGSYPGIAARIWVFADGRSSPTFQDPYGGRDNAVGLPDNFMEQFAMMLDSAASHGVKVIPTLWDFLAFDKQTYGSQPNPMGGRHLDLFVNEGKVNMFIDNVLRPLVAGVRGHPGLLAWDVFNEPEWAITESDSDNDPSKRNDRGQPQPWFQHISLYDMQRFVGRCAAVIHRDGNALVTLGSGSLKFNRDDRSVANCNSWTYNYWSDEALYHATSDGDAYLDFYSPHWYPWMTDPCMNPFMNNRAYGLKPMVIGESKSNTTPADLPANFPINMSAQYMAQYAIDKQYAGLWFWSITAAADGQGSFDDFKNYMFTRVP